MLLILHFKIWGDWVVRGVDQILYGVFLREDFNLERIQISGDFSWVSAILWAFDKGDHDITSCFGLWLCRDDEVLVEELEFFFLLIFLFDRLEFSILFFFLGSLLFLLFFFWIFFLSRLPLNETHTLVYFIFFVKFLFNLRELIPITFVHFQVELFPLCHHVCSDFGNILGYFFD